MKTCKICRIKFEPTNSLQVTCWNIQCALAHGRTKAHAIKRKETKARKQALMSLSDHHKQTQAIFNKYIRLRDGAWCISCQTEIKGQVQAGHYLTDKALRYNENNCHSQCVKCNNWLSGNQLEYKKHLLTKIGQFELSKLEGNHPAP